jgi:hypothetical protein
MTIAQPLSSYRYIALPYPNGDWTMYGIYRIYCINGTVHPSRWNVAHGRLVSCSDNVPGVVVPMYHVSQRLEDKLRGAGIGGAPLEFRYVDLETAETVSLAYTFEAFVS